MPEIRPRPSHTVSPAVIGLLLLLAVSSPGLAHMKLWATSKQLVARNEKLNWQINLQRMLAPNLLLLV